MITRYECPLTGCDWFHDSPDVPSGRWPWKGSIEATVHAVATERVTANEQIIAAHFETHPIVEWARDLQRERERADSAERRLDLFMSVVARAELGLS